MNRSAKGLLVLLVLACAAVAASTSAQVVINELHYNPFPDTGQEFLELHNTSAVGVDVSGWTLSDGITFTVPASTTIPGHGYLVVAANPAALLSATGYAGAFQFSGALSNGGELITLKNASAVTVDAVNYDDAAPWPAGAGSPDGTGPSLELLNPTLDNSVGSAWLSSTGVNGTPGAQNSVFSNAATIQSETPARRTAVASLPSVSITFSSSVTGVTAGSLTVGGSAATSVSCPSCSGGAGAGPYTFTGYATPASGSVTIAVAGGTIVPFGGDSWTVSTGIVVVINELHYHPFDADADAEFFELHNVGGQAVNISGWAITSGVVGTVPASTSLPAGGFFVFAKVPALVQARTGYTGSVAWTSGSLSNGGETVLIADTANNVMDTVTFGDGGQWPKPPDGSGPSLELINPTLPNQYGGAWRASLANWGTPGAQNSTYVAAPPPIITEPAHTPLIPAPSQAVTVTVLALDDGPTPPTVTLYYRQDFDPTIAYTSTPMFDDGAHGDGAAGDGRFGATVPGLPDGARLDFAVRASDGVSVSAAPPGHNTLNAGEYPTQTYLAKFDSAPATIDFPHYHLITTQRTRNLQNNHDENEYDATFLQCTPPATTCQIFYNITERYRGQSSLNQHPHGYRISFPASTPLQSEMGFPITKMNLMSQRVNRQHLGYQFFRESFGGAIPAAKTQFVRLDTNPLSHGGTQDFAYINVEKEDEDFLTSEDGSISPLRFPNECTGNLAVCADDAGCPVGETCFERDEGNIYKGVLSGDLQYRGTNPDSYRTSYEKETNGTDDDWTDLINVTFAIDPDTTPDAQFEASLNAVADELEWARWFAIHMLLVNQEGGIYRDTNDDFLFFMEPAGSPRGYNAKFFPRDMDSVFGGFGTFAQETIWRTTTQIPQRFIRNNAYAGRFVGALCEMLNTQFTQAAMDAKIDAMPDAIANATQKQNFKNWVAARITFVNAEITRQTTLTGVPASPYTNANPTIALSGQLNQCGTYRALLNGAPVPNFSVFNHTWSGSYTLVPGPNQITIQSVDVNGAVLDQATANVLYDPPITAQNSLRLTMPKRMVNDKTLTLRAEILDSIGRINWHGCFDTLGTVTMTRVSDSANIPITVTFFDNSLPVPADSIRFFHGVGSVSFTLDGGAAVPAGDYRVTVTVGSVSANKVITLLSAPTWRVMPATLSGADLVWGPDENIRISSHQTTVPGGSTLTIHPGTLIMVDTTGGFEDGTLIVVNGQVNAVGTQDRPIHFFSERAAAAMIHTVSGPSLSNPDAWRGIYHHDSGSSTYKWTILTGAGNGDITSHPRPPIIALLNNHNLLVEDCVLVDSTGMMIQSQAGAVGTYTIRRTLVSRTGIGAEFIQGGHNLLIEDSWWTQIGRGPTTPLRYDGDALHVDGAGSTQMLRGLVIAFAGDEGIDHSNSTFTLENSIIHDIPDKAISMTGGLAILHNVLIFNSGTGVRGAAQVYNSTISANGPILSPQIIQESIIWPQGIGSCSANFDYTDGGDTAHVPCGTANISVNPQFTNTGQCDYNPTAGSPVLTAGPTGGRIGWLGFPTATSCSVDSECNDNNVCSVNTCLVGVCDFRPIAGCTPCTTNANCEDGDQCTVNTCGVQGTCQAAQPLDCNDFDGCTTDTCNPGSGCQHTAANCDDGNVCTTDACVSGSCSHVNNTVSCSDGNLCTTGDICGGGTCSGTPVSCPVGFTCNPGTGTCVSGPTTVSFQDGLNGYNGTRDTYLRQAAPDEIEGALNNWRVDLENPAPNQEIGVIGFDGIVGTGPGQIPPGSTINSADLILVVTNASVAPAGTVNESAIDWVEATTTWNNFGGDAGVQSDEFRASPQYAAPIATGSTSTSVTASVQDWVNGLRPNFGWIIRPANLDGLQVNSAEFATVADRPRLTVTYTPQAAGCTTDLNCTDNDACNGSETCQTGVCQPGTPLNCNDGNVCTTDSCIPASGCSNVNNTIACNDLDFCTTNDTCAGGSCVGGPAPNCNDGNVCTTDSCIPASGCSNVNNTLPCGDALFCNGDEVCSGGSCQPGTPVNCDDGLACSSDTCNEGTDLCEHAPCAVTVAAAGSRWIQVTPPAGLASVALRVRQAGMSCLPKYVDAAGELVAAPVFRSSAAWGTVHVGDRPIVPSTAYTVEAEVTAGTPIGSGTATTWAWGNVNNVDDVNVFDVICTLDGFQGIFTQCTPYGDDQNAGEVAHPVTVDLDDILAVLDAFSGSAYPDATPCMGQLVAGRGSAPRIGATDKSTEQGLELSDVQVRLVASKRVIAPGETVRINVYAEGLNDVRGYQVALEIGAGRAGTIVSDRVTIASDRDDYGFHGSPAYTVTDAARVRLAGVRPQGGVTASGTAYLGSFEFRASEDAVGTFHVDFRTSETLLRNSSSDPLGVTPGAGVNITVSGSSSAPHPRKRTVLNRSSDATESQRR